VYVRFYPAHLSQAERRALGLLRHSKIRSILLYLLQEPQLGKGELAKKLGVSPSTVSYYIERLRKANILSFAEGNRATFLVDPAMLIGLLRRYRSSFLDRLVDSFVELWEFKREE
jgi:predicted transcriptional regulator